MKPKNKCQREEGRPGGGAVGGGKSEIMSVSQRVTGLETREQMKG